MPGLQSGGPSGDSTAALIVLGVGAWFYLHQGPEPLRLDDLYKVPVAAPEE